MDSRPSPDATEPDFDEEIDRYGTHSEKWDAMERLYGLAPGEGLAMWVADMDFRPPAAIQRAVETMAAHGVYGYFGEDGDYLAAIRWWMKTRHGWAVDPDWITTTHGLVNAVGLCVDAWSAPGDAVAVMTPVYHAFARVIRAGGRELRELPLALRDGRYEMDFAAWEARMTGAERILILCSPHNPGGRVWTREELRATADFAARHDLVLVSDEIHHDLLMPGHRHLPMPLAAPEAVDRLVMLTAATKTFNIAGCHTGNAIIPAPELRTRFIQRLRALGISANAFGAEMVTAGYSPEGALWVDRLNAYLDGNRRIFDEGIAAIPGLCSMPLEATYLAWVDFAGTGMTPEEVTARVERGARIAVNRGPSFGTGGESFLRFNFATPRARIVEAVERLQAAFADLQ